MRQVASAAGTVAARRRRSARRPRAGTLAIVLCCLVLACSAPVREYRCRDMPSATPEEARQLWICQREIIERAVEGRGFTLEELRGAASFFEAVTGIAADVDWTGIGPLPEPGLRENLSRWDQWLVDHAGELDRAIASSGWS